MHVYHFLNEENALDDLKRRRLHVSRFADLNDPFELLSVDFSIKADRPKFRKWKNKVSDQYGVLCFSKIWDHPLLWSHYADKHRGICLGFSVPEKILKEVEYAWKRLLPEAERDLQQGEPSAAFAERLFRTKFEDWDYEQELRVLLELKNAVKEGDHYYHVFGQDLDLKEVIAGPRSNVTKAKLRASIGRYPAVKITKARIAFMTFRVTEQLRGFPRASSRI